CFIAGHLIIFPQQEVLSLAEISAQGLQYFGKTVALTHAVIKKIINPSRIYTLSFNEVLPSLHFHIFPRTEEMRALYETETSKPVNGSALFEWAREKYKNKPDNQYPKLIENINHKFSELAQLLNQASHTH